MAGGNFPIIISTDEDLHFTTELVTNAIETENISNGYITTWPNCECNILSLAAIADQKLALEFAFFGTDGFTDADPDLDTFLWNHTFYASSFLQIAGAGLYRASLTGITDAFYRDADGTGEFHIALINRDATTKATEAATGAVRLRLAVQRIL